MVGWQGDQPLDFNGFCHCVSRILELSNSSQPFIQFLWHTEKCQSPQCDVLDWVSEPWFFVCLRCLHLLEADKWQKDVRVGLHQSMFKQKQLWSIHHWNSLEIPSDSSDWQMKLRQNKNWSYSRLCNNWFHHHTPQVCLKIALVFVGLGSLRFSTGPIEK